MIEQGVTEKDLKLIVITIALILLADFVYVKILHWNHPAHGDDSYINYPRARRERFRTFFIIGVILLLWIGFPQIAIFIGDFINAE